MMSVDDLLEGEPINRIFFLVLICAGTFVLLKRRINLSQVLKGNVWIFLFLLYGGISIAWSDFPFVSFKRWIKVIGEIVMVLLILTDPAPVDAVKTIVRRSAYLFFPLSILFIKYYPQWGRGYDSWTGAVFFTGVTNNKNTLGLLCLVCGLVLFWNLFLIWRSRKITPVKRDIFIHTLLLSMIAWLLWKSNSATSLWCLIMGSGVVGGLQSARIRGKLKSVGQPFFVILLLFLPILFLVNYDIFLASAIDTTGHSLTFWGRVELWKELIAMHSNPWIGVGFESFWLGDRLTSIWEKNWWMPDEAHNGYLDIYLNLGWVGLILFLGVVLSCFGKIRRALVFDFDYGRLRLGFIIVALLYNITEAAFKGLSPILFFFLLFAMEYPQEHILEETTL